MKSMNQSTHYTGPGESFIFIVLCRSFPTQRTMFHSASSPSGVEVDDVTTQQLSPRRGVKSRRTQESTVAPRRPAPFQSVDKTISYLYIVGSAPCRDCALGYRQTPLVRSKLLLFYCEYRDRGLQINSSRCIFIYITPHKKS